LFSNVHIFEASLEAGVAFIALKLLVGHQEEYLTCKNLSDEVLAGVVIILSGVTCK